MRISWILWTCSSFCMIYDAFGLANVVIQAKHDVFSAERIRDAYKTALKEILTRHQNFKKSDSQPHISSLRHQYLLQTDRVSHRQSYLQEPFEVTSRILLEKCNLPRKEALNTLSKVPLERALQDQQNYCNAAYQHDPCNPKEAFRRISGLCNNLGNMLWGSARSCYQRFLPSDYADGVSAKRTGADGKDLPSPRTLSLLMHPDVNRPSRTYSHLLMVFSQFVSHDVNLTPFFTLLHNLTLSCCPPSPQNSRECDPLLFSNDDPIYSKTKTTCLSNIRSGACSTCSLGPRQQINLLTSYIDASVVYSSDVNESYSLRKLDGTGLLKFQHIPGVGELPPKSFSPATDRCSYQKPELACFQAGELRANQNNGATSMHIIFLREHNRIARLLKKLNPRWVEERIYQEARRIMGAQIQMITYKEMLPIVLGQKTIDQLNLNVLASGYSQYDSTIDATLHNEFAAAAYRFGHTLINRYFANHNFAEKMQDSFFYPFGYYDGGYLEGFLEGLGQYPTQQADRYFVEDITSHMYQIRGQDKGLDLIYLNINRGRDHGIPGYKFFVELCTGVKITNFDQLRKFMSKQVVEKLKKLYKCVEDIDLYTGGISERVTSDGGLLGPTFTCLLGRQFRDLKFGDRFFFEHAQSPYAFTPEQLHALRRVRLSSIICANTKIGKFQPFALKVVSQSNPLTNCEDISFLDLSLWKE